MKRTFGLAAGALLFAAGCGSTDAADTSSSRTPFDMLGQEVDGESMSDVTPVTGPVAGKLDGKAFTATGTVIKFVDEGGKLSVINKLTGVTGLDADAAKKLEGSLVKLPLSAEPEGGFPTDGSEAFCENLTLFSQPTALKSPAGALSVERFTVDFATTPGTGVIIAQFACLIPDLLPSGGKLDAVPEEVSQNLVVLLNGIIDPLGTNNVDTTTVAEPVAAGADASAPAVPDAGAPAATDAGAPAAADAGAAVGTDAGAAARPDAGTTRPMLPRLPLFPRLRDAGR